MNIKRTEKVVRIATIGIVIYLLCFGVAMAFFPIRTFWNDEWRLIYNIKFKDVHQLWGRLDLLQQCPRVYLTVIKKITAFFDYSYTSLRLPALVISVASVFFIFHLRNKLVTGSAIFAYLFALIFLSSQTFTDYMTQVKQYEMDLFLCLLALWQLLALLTIREQGVADNKGKYLLLCFSLLAAPFFSYTYPIAVAPIFLIIFINALKGKENRKATHASLYLPLLFVTASIVVFYIIDVRQLMADNRMYSSYKSMLGQESVQNNSFTDFWNLFALVGSGLLFEIIFGIVGLAAFFYSIYKLIKIKLHKYTLQDQARLYAVLLLIVTLGLIFCGKLMGGVARLTSFTVPAISLLIVSLLADLKDKYQYVKVANIITAILFLGLVGNIASTCINAFTYREYSDRILTYEKTSEALQLARLNKIPMLYTDGVRGDRLPDTVIAPGHITTNMITPEQIAGVDRLCTEVILKVNPEYKTWDSIALYMAPDAKWTNAHIQQLPPQFTSAVVCDGINYSIIKK